MSQYKILIATPTRGACPEAARVTYGYARLLRRIAADTANFDILDPNDMDDAGYGLDIVRSRSRIVQMFLDATPRYTHLLFWDDDVIVRNPHVLGNMLKSGHDVIGAPYPRKVIYWDKLAKLIIAQQQAATGPVEFTPQWLEGHALEYPVRLNGESGGLRVKVDPHRCVEINEIGFGFVLISRKCLELMVEHYRGPLSFTDSNGLETVALFQLILPSDSVTRKDGVLFSEDYSFCERWRNLGGKVHCYIGPGSPLDHAGEYVFRGHREGFIDE